MKKIMFSDKYLLTGAVLTGRKTMTRRIIPATYQDCEPVEFGTSLDGNFYIIMRRDGRIITDLAPTYQPGEVVAIAHSYETLANSRYCSELGMMDTPTTFKKEFCGKGWGNKMFVRADLMPHQIKIMKVKVERLQDISEEDAMKEGVFKYEKPPLHHECDPFAPWPPYVKPYKHDIDNLKYYCSARYAFAYLIDKVCGKGTWDRNPLVFAYKFKLVK